MLITKTELSADEARSAINTLIGDGRIIQIGQAEQSLLFTLPGWQKLGKQASAVLEEYHKKNATRTGMPKAELSNRLKLGRFAPGTWQRLSAEGVITEEATSVRLPSWQVKLTADQQKSVNDFLKALADNPYSPPADKIPASDLLNLLVEQGKVVKLSENVVFSTEAYKGMIEKIVTLIKANGKTTLGEVRDMLQTSRRYAQALLENLDDRKITRRVGDERVLY